MNNVSRGTLSQPGARLVATGMAIEYGTAAAAQWWAMRERQSWPQGGEDYEFWESVIGHLQLMEQQR